MKKTLVALGLAVAFTASAPALAYDITSTAPVNVTAAKIALQSHDPVAYFTVGKPVLGSEKYSAEHEGAIYRFSSADNLAKFKADPAKYAPQHGGFCRMGAALGLKLDGDPSLFRVDNGRLSVYSYPAALKGFSADVAGNGAKADSKWPGIKNKAPKDL
ncbi:YHS domain-containing (seleno)protein [Coralliovum pocilloporae]|uniref:YHS domain-containing (seleno)protein n=1 Tax=Coralliovum pocilloporae TaxID=3066369 RepID=UPI003307AB21